MMKITTIETGYFKLDGGAMHGVVPRVLWDRFNPADENNLCSWALRCLLVEIDDRKILIDTGIGDKQDEKFFSHYYLHGEDTLLGSLEKAGLKPEDITDVFLTHLHFDHVGGAVIKVNDEYQLQFPNADYWTHKEHWKWATEPNDREKASFLKENILPIEESGKLKFIDVKDGEEWLPGFAIKYANGHTESMMMPLLSYGNRKILYVADLLPSVAHIPVPWVMAYDTRPLETLVEKKRILEEAANNNWYLYFEHDAHNQMCTLKNTDKGVRMDKTLTIEELK